MSEASEFFTELLYGVGSPIGILLLVSLMLLVSLADKRAGILFIPFSLIMGVSYLSNIAVDSNFMWFSLLMFISTIFLTVRLAKGK